MNAEMVEKNIGLVYHFAKRFDRSSPDWEDIVQVGMMALCKAVEGFDPERGLAFSTYASACIKGSMNRYWAEQCCGPVRPTRSAGNRYRYPKCVYGDEPMWDDDNTTVLELLSDPFDYGEQAEQTAFAATALSWLQKHVKGRDFRIYLLWLRGDRQEEIARRIGLTQSGISRIVRRLHTMLQDNFGESA